MIEPPPLPAVGRGGSPRDGIGHTPGGQHATSEQTTEVAHRRTPIAVLHRTHNRCCATAILGGDQHAHPRTDMHGAATGDQRRPTGGTHRRTGLIAARASDAEDHIGRDRPHATAPRGPAMPSGPCAMVMVG